MIYIILGIAFLLRAIYVSFPSLVWWDTAIYIGMGKYMFTHGAIGFWESFRPLLWPAILGTFWKLGINPVIGGNIIEVITATGAIYLVYKLGEHLMPRAGLYASALLSFTGVYFFFTNITITDIPSTFVILLAVWFAVKEKYYLSGLMIALSFTLRFPQGLFLVVLSLAIVILNQKAVKKSLIDIVKLGLGFATLAVPYLAINYKIYGDALKPIKAGNDVFLASIGQGSSLFYYFWNLFLENPFLVVGIVVFFYWIYKFRTTLTNRVQLITFLSLLIVGGYFIGLAHKELRYSIAFLPFIALISGYGLSKITARFSDTTNSIVVGAISAILLIGGMVYGLPQWKNGMTDANLTAYYNFFKAHPNAKVLTTNPQIVADADIKVSEVMGTWQDAVDALPRMYGKVDYIGVNTCQIGCNAGLKNTQCIDAEQTTRAILQSLKPVFSSSSFGCNYTVYQYPAK